MINNGEISINSIPEISSGAIVILLKKKQLYNRLNAIIAIEPVIQLTGTLNLP